MVKRDILNLKKRKEIYDYILSNPGTHLSKISKKLNIPKTTLFYHLTYLDKRELIRRDCSGRFSRYYGINEVSRKHKAIFSILRQNIPRKIIFYIIFHERYPTQIEISRYLQKHPATISFHLNKLIEFGLLEQKTMGNEIRYKINSESYFYDFFIIYHHTMLDDLIPFSLEWWDYNISINRVDKIMDFAYEIFPHPYYS